MQFPAEILRKCWFLAGPTAVGKSDLSLRLAGHLSAEIVSLDSMAVYRRMDIGTAKPSSRERTLVAHHLVDVVDPHEEFSVAEYVEAALLACREICNRGRIPLFVGGTGLYLRAVLRGVFSGPPADWEFRRELDAIVADQGPHELHARLARIDPNAAHRLHANDVRRVIRALEVNRITGRPLSEQQQQIPLPESERPPHVYWLEPPRDWLYERINRRVEHMLAAGLVEEVQELLDLDPPLGRSARQGLGYKEVIEHIEGQSTPDEMLDAIQTRTRQFAKRQHTWFRNLVECQAIERQPQASTDQLIDRLLTIAAGRK